MNPQAKKTSRATKPAKNKTKRMKLTLNEKQTLSLEPTMNSWDSMPARQVATLSFSLEMHKEGPNGARRTGCKTDSEYAKRLFASIGRFYLEGDVQSDPEHPLPAIPTNTVFRVFENKKEASDVLVTLVLPAAEQPFPDPFIPDNVWKCTWEPY